MTRLRWLKKRSKRLYAVGSAEIKFILVMYFSFNGHAPLTATFDTPEACQAVEDSLRRVADTALRITPRQMYLRGHEDTPYFIPCTLAKEE